MQLACYMAFVEHQLPLCTKLFGFLSGISPELKLQKGVAKAAVGSSTHVQDHPRALLGISHFDFFLHKLGFCQRDPVSPLLVIPLSAWDRLVLTWILKVQTGKTSRSFPKCPHILFKSHRYNWANHDTEMGREL